jgi:hypothetical protein
MVLSVFGLNIISLYIKHSRIKQQANNLYKLSPVKYKEITCMYMYNDEHVYLYNVYDKYWQKQKKNALVFEMLCCYTAITNLHCT